VNNYAGYEILDPDTWDPPDAGCTDGDGCRNSDAALIRHKKGMDAHLGRIARPTSKNTGVITIDSSDPEFIINRTRGWSVEGETLDKVGYASGWTSGEVMEGCEDISPSNYDETIMCVMTVAAEAKPGDSGAPVFRKKSGNYVELRGVLFAGYPVSASDTCVNVPTPSCPAFAASNLGGIIQDLDPDGYRDLTWY